MVSQIRRRPEAKIYRLQKRHTSRTQILTITPALQTIDQIGGKRQQRETLLLRPPPLEMEDTFLFRTPNNVFTLEKGRTKSRALRSMGASMDPGA